MIGKIHEGKRSRSDFDLDWSVIIGLRHIGIAIPKKKVDHLPAFLLLLASKPSEINSSGNGNGRSDDIII